MDEQEKTTETENQPKQVQEFIKGQKKRKKKGSVLGTILKIIIWFVVIVILVFLTLFITTQVTEFNSIEELIRYLLGHT